MFSHGDILGMQKDRLSSTHGERLSLHVITHCLVIQRRKKKKKFRNTHYRAQFHQLLDATGQSLSSNHIRYPDKNLLQTSRASTTSWRSIPGVVFATESGQVIRRLVCVELCSTVAMLLYCIW